MNYRSFLRLCRIAIAILATMSLCHFGWAQPAASPPAGSSDVAEAAPELNAAIARLQAGDLAGCMQQLDEAVKKHPELPPAKALLAEMLMSAQPNLARELAEQAVLETPDAPEPYGLLGDMARRERRWAEADLLYRQSLKAAESLKDNPKRKAAADLRAHKGLVVVAEPFKRWEDLQKQAEAILQANPTEAIALQQLGQALFHQGKTDEALEKFRAAAKLDPKLHVPEVILATLYEKAGNRQKAAQSMIAALKANERDLRTRLDATQWAMDTGQLEQAKQQARSALVIDPNSQQAQMLCGLIAVQMKDYATAEEWLQKALLQDPSNATILSNLALALVEQDDNAKKAKALKYAQINTRLNPQDSEALATYGWVAYKLGQLNEAEAMLAQASQAPGINPDTLYYRARIAIDRKNLPMAKQLLEAALKTTGRFTKRQDAEQLLKEMNP